MTANRHAALIAALDAATAHLPTDTIIGPDGRPYLERRHLTAATRYHRIVADDPQPDLHDHPWDFTTVLLAGGYIEHTPTERLEHTAPTALHRTAQHPHRLELPAGVAETWTLITTGPARRRWGFHTPTGWEHWSRYTAAGTYLDGLDARPADEPDPPPPPADRHGGASLTGSRQW